MIQCPNCKATLPDWVQQCQFCQAPTGHVLRPRQNAPNVRAFEVPAWIWACYYGIAGLITIESIIDIVTTLVHAKHGLGFFDGVFLVFSAVECLVGVGLLLRLELVRSIVNIVCFAGILRHLFGFLTSFALMIVWPVVGVLLFVLNILFIIQYGFLIYLIGETDKAY